MWMLDDVRIFYVFTTLYFLILKTLHTMSLILLQASKVASAAAYVAAREFTKEDSIFDSPVFWTIVIIVVLAIIVLAAAGWQKEANKKK